jgi:iron complex outermembrane receptor protein
VFDVKYGGIQVPISGRSFVPPRPEISQALISAGDAKAKGFEFEGTWLPSRAIMLSTGVGYTDFKYTRLDPRVTTGLVEYMVANRPKWTVALSGQYTSEPLFDEVRLVARLDGNWKSASNGTASVFGTTVLSPDQVPIYKAAQRIGAYWLVNGRVALQGFKVAGADAELALWGRNIFNNKSMSYSPSLGSVIPTTYEQARTFGLDLMVEF